MSRKGTELRAAGKKDKSPNNLITQVSKDGSAPAPVPSSSNKPIPKVTFWNKIGYMMYKCFFCREYKRSVPLLPPLDPNRSHQKSLVLDLDETLVHSCFKPISNPDFIIPVEIEGVVHDVYVLKRPGVDRFLRELGDKYEIVIFTASLSKYADPLLDKLDMYEVFQSRLFRESCTQHCNNYVKDLERLGRDINKVLIVDNSPHCYQFQPGNAIAIESWFESPDDVQLDRLLDFLLSIQDVDNVVAVLAACNQVQEEEVMVTRVSSAQQSIKTAVQKEDTF